MNETGEFLHPMPPRRTLRDQLLDAEQLRHPLNITTAAGHSLSGTLTDVGIDYVTIESESSTSDVALFHIVSVGW